MDRIITENEIAKIEHRLLFKVYDDGGLKGMEEYVEGVLDMAHALIDYANGKGE